MTGLALVLPLGGVSASGITKIQVDNDRQSVMEVEYLDSSTIRMNMPQQQESGYMLVRDGKAYSVHYSQGRAMVMDMAQLGNMARSFGANMGGDDSFKNELVSHKNTGKLEKVAGYAGEVYSITWRDNTGVHTDDVVLSGHKDVLEYSEAWMNMAKTMAGAMGASDITDDSIWRFLERERKGVLRMGNEFRVVSINPGKLEAERFKLPAAPTAMPTFGGYQAPAAAPSGAYNGGATGSASSTGNQASSSWGSIFGQKAERQVDRQEARVEGQANREIDQAVDKAIDGAIRSLFGR